VTCERRKEGEHSLLPLFSGRMEEASGGRMKKNLRERKSCGRQGFSLPLFYTLSLQKEELISPHLLPRSGGLQFFCRKMTLEKRQNK